MVLRRTIAVLITAQLLIGGVGPAAAADWIVQSIAGLALLRDEQQQQWVALAPGEVLAEPFTLRTLGRGQVSVGTRNAALSIRSNSTVTVSSQSTIVHVELLQGAVSALVQRDRKALLSAGPTKVDLAVGSAEIEMTPRGAKVRSREGIVSVRDAATDAPVLLSPGKSAQPEGGDNARETALGGSGRGRGSGEGNTEAAGEASSASESRGNSSENSSVSGRGSGSGRP